MAQGDREHEIGERLSSLGIDEQTRAALMATGSAEPGRVEALDAATRLVIRLAARGAISDPREAAALVRGVVECELGARRTDPRGLQRRHVDATMAATTGDVAERPTVDPHALLITTGALLLGTLGFVLQLV